MNEKSIAVIVSSRKGQNTELIVDYIIEVLNQKNIDVDKFYLNNTNISTCKGYEYCIESETCIINDDISKIIDNMKQVSGYIFASPSYNYNVTAQMKVLLDRTFCLNYYRDGWKSRLSSDKKAIVVGVCAGNNKDSMGYTVKAMSIPLSELGVKIINIIEYYNTKYMPVCINSNIKNEIKNRIENIFK